jgi:hypothetical protein
VVNLEYFELQDGHLRPLVPERHPMAGYQKSAVPHKDVLHIMYGKGTVRGTTMTMMCVSGENCRG